MDISQFNSGDILVALSPVLIGAITYLWKEHKNNAKKCDAANRRLEEKIGDQSAEYKALVHGALMEQKETQIRSNAVMEKVAVVMDKHIDQSAVTNALNRETLEYLKKRRGA
jgi:uncharacterized membrane protein